MSFHIFLHVWASGASRLNPACLFRLACTQKGREILKINRRRRRRRHERKRPKTGRREAVWSIVECKSHQKNMPDSTVTLPRPRNAGKKHKNDVDDDDDDKKPPFSICFGFSQPQERYG